MRINQINNLISIRNGYHPILKQLFHKYKNLIATIIFNACIGICCLIIFALVLFGIFSFYISLQSVRELCNTVSIIVFVFSTISSVKYMYDFMYGEEEQSFLKVLPVTKGEILTSLILYNYRKQIITSFVLFLIAIIAVLVKSYSLIFISLFLILLIIIPFLAIVFSMFLCFVWKKIYVIRQVKQKTYKIKKESIVISLVKYEIKNMYLFNSLKIELIMQVFFFIGIAFSSIYITPIFVCIYVIYPALSSINISSFSREGEFHYIIESLPIDKYLRFKAKIIAYMSQTIPIIFFCMIYISIKLQSYMFVFVFISYYFCIQNITFLGLLQSQKNCFIHWTNQRDAININIVVIVKGCIIGIITGCLLFIPDSFLLLKILGYAISIYINIKLFYILKKKYILQQ